MLSKGVNQMTYEELTEEVEAAFFDWNRVHIDWIQHVFVLHKSPKAFHYPKDN